MEPSTGTNGICCHTDEKQVEKFSPVPQSKVSRILKVLEDRLPRSANVYNSALRLSRHPGEFSIYTLNGDTSMDSWIVVVHHETGLDVSQIISISAPQNPVITSDIKKAFIDTAAIDWCGTYMFNAIDRDISGIIAEISWFVKRRTTVCYPDYYYTITKEDALKLEIPPAKDENMVIKPLDLGKGASFVADNWRHGEGVDNTIDYVRRRIEWAPSVGIYVDGEPVSGAVVHGDYNIGMLMTDPVHRNKGCGLICMRTLLKNLAKEGYVPSCTVEQMNQASNRLQVKCGMTVTHECDFIKCSHIFNIEQ